MGMSMNNDESHGLPDVLSTDEIFERIVIDANAEFSRSARLLMLSGIAGGLNISLSFLAQAHLVTKTGDTATGVIASMAYPLGFLFVVLGRYQLFTENTLSPVALVLARRASIPKLMRIWGLVLLANFVGTAAAALFFAKGGLFDGETLHAAIEIVRHASAPAPMTLFTKGIAAGWLVAGMVWLVHATRTVMARILIVFATIYLVSLLDLSHCIIGSAEQFFGLLVGEVTLRAAFLGYLLPVTLGNTIGGVVLVAFLNFAQTRKSHGIDEIAEERLSWRELLLGEAG